MRAAKQRGQEPPSKDKPFAVDVALAATHCGTGCFFGDIVAEWIVVFMPLVLFGQKAFGTWALDYAFAFLFGIAFRYFTIKPMQHLSVGKGLVAAVKADALSLTAWQAGMYGWMAIVIFSIVRRVPKTNPVFWFMMQIAMVTGFITSYPANWWLLKKGIKERMEKENRQALILHAQARGNLRSNYVERLSSPGTATERFFNREVRRTTTENEECDEQLLAEYAAMLAFYIASVAVLIGIASHQSRFPKRFSLFDFALLGVATHKLSRLVAKDRITGIIRAPFLTYIRSAGAGEVEEEPRGRGIQRGIGNLVSCPYCMGPWSATALAFGFLFAPRVTRFFAGILGSVAISDFLHRAYVAAKGNS